MKTTGGTPFSGYLSLVNGAIGPSNIPIYVTKGAASAYTLQAGEYLVVTNVSVSSSDGTQALITVDDGAATPRKLVSTYLSNVQPPLSVAFPPGVGTTKNPATNLRATASAVTTAKTVEIVINGFITMSP